MLHYLTIGFLDPEAVQRREVLPVRPLSPDVLALLDRHLDGGAMTIGGQTVSVGEGWIRCPWHAPVRNRSVEAFAIEAARLGCVLADVGCARVIDVERLTTRHRKTRHLPPAKWVSVFPAPRWPASAATANATASPALRAPAREFRCPSCAGRKLGALFRTAHGDRCVIVRRPRPPSACALGGCMNAK